MFGFQLAPVKGSLGVFTPSMMWWGATGERGIAASWVASEQADLRPTLSRENPKRFVSFLSIVEFLPVGKPLVLLNLIQGGGGWGYALRHDMCRGGLI